ncbi:MAG: DUF4190 domain-containing protein [Lachnospiraceae bacterium]|nr:DUF4190 domain-containing protein [Lachnospiraceae bacterium]
MEENKSGLCTAGMVLGIIGLVTSFIFNLGFIPCVIALIFSIICLAKRKQPKGRAIAGLVTSIIGLIVGFIVSIVAAIILFSIGMSFALIGYLFNETMQAINSGDTQQLINVINNLEDGGFDYESIINSEDYNNFINGYNSDSDYSDLLNDLTSNPEYNDLLNDLTSSPEYNDLINSINSGSSGVYDFVLGTTAFEDLTKYGYSYEYGESDYQVFSKNGVEYEFPAYVYDYTDFGTSREKAFDAYLSKNGFYDNDFSFYSDELYQYNSEWAYGAADQIGYYTDEQGAWNPYELYLVAFNENSNDMVILIYRLDQDQWNDDNFDSYLSDLESLLNHMKYAGTY